MIDVIIVNWNGGYLLRNCVSSVLVNSILINSLIIIDNASNDGSIKNLPKHNKIQLIKNDKNVGFAKACNQGFSISNAEFVLLLNPDTELFSDTLQLCTDFMTLRNDIDILGVRLIDKKNKTTISCARFPKPSTMFYDAMGFSKLFPRIFKPATLMTDWDHNGSKFVNQVMGAFMFIKKDVFKKIGYFDERFFVYYEELDFSLRLARAKGKTFYNADIKAVHIGNGTTDTVKAFRLFLILRSRLQYSKKHFSYVGNCIVWVSTWLIEPITRILFLLATNKWNRVSEVFKGYSLLAKNKIELRFNEKLI